MMSDSEEVLSNAEKVLKSICPFPKYEFGEGLGFGGNKFDNIRKAMVDPTTTLFQVFKCSARFKTESQRSTF
jgi:hypothetical protein